MSPGRDDEDCHESAAAEDAASESSLGVILCSWEPHPLPLIFLCLACQRDLSGDHFWGKMLATVVLCHVVLCWNTRCHTSCGQALIELLLICLMSDSLGSYNVCSSDVGSCGALARLGSYMLCVYSLWALSPATILEFHK